MSDRTERKSQSLSFQNLQPINYLKTFNKMLQQMGKALPFQTPQTSRQLKLVKFSKFPLYSYYGQMQAILEGHQKKQKQNQKLSKKDYQSQENEQKFVKRHHQFVKSAINKILEDNQAQQKLLLKSKKFHLSSHFAQKSEQNQQQIIKLVKYRSEPKLKNSLNTKLGSGNTKRKQTENKVQFRSLQKIDRMRSKNKIKMGSKTQKVIHQKGIPTTPNSKIFKRINQNHLQQQTLKNLKTLHSQADLKKKDSENLNLNHNPKNQQKNTIQNESDNPIFKKLQLPGEISKFRTRNKGQIEQIFEKNKNEVKSEKKHYYALTERNLCHGSENTNNLYHEGQNYKNVRQQKQDQLIHLNIIFKTVREKDQISKQKLKNSELTSIRKLPQISKRLKNEDEYYLNQNRNKNELSEFQKLVENLHKEKTKTQVSFSANIQSKIKNVNQQIQERIQKVKRFDISYK